VVARVFGGVPRVEAERVWWRVCLGGCRGLNLVVCSGSPTVSKKSKKEESLLGIEPRKNS
jgi:hypothetical protein